MKSTLTPPVKVSPSPRSHRVVSTLLWSVTILLVLLFLVEGGGKLLLDAGTIRTFQKWGYPIWFVFVVGLLEFSGAVLIIIPRFALLGAALLVVDMLGAIVTGIVQGIVPIILFSAFILLLIALIGWARRKRFVWWGLLQRRFRSATTMQKSVSEGAGWRHDKEQANGR